MVPYVLLCWFHSRYRKSPWGHVVLEHPSTFDTPAKKRDIIDDFDAFRKGKDYYASPSSSSRASTAVLRGIQVPRQEQPRRRRPPPPCVRPRQSSATQEGAGEGQEAEKKKPAKSTHEDAEIVEDE
jgi:hypothetical protein